ncbi:MAG: endonuclease/exonuclease/phosphatase family protein [Rikenellaceae bacterium]
MLSYNRHNSYRGKRQAAARLPIWVRLVDLVAFVVTIAAIVALLTALMSQYIAPSQGWVFSVMGLLSPIIYVVTVTVALYWIIRWNWRLTLPTIVVLAIGANRISLIVKVPVKRDYNTESYRGTLKVMSYNVRLLYNDDWKSSTSEIIAYVKEQRPDIVALQEVNKQWIFDSINTSNQYSKYTKKELAIYSRYPIINSGESFDASNWESGSSIYVDIVVQNDTIRVFNNHLHSTHIKREDNDYLTSTQVVRDSDRSSQLSDIVKRLQTNALERADQMLALREVMDATPYEMIVCGDFNETPISYTYNKLSRRLTDSFQVCGDNYSYTFRGFFNLLRIDYILTSPRITPRSYEVDRSMVVSDHLPVIVRVKIEKQL